MASAGSSGDRATAQPMSPQQVAVCRCTKHLPAAPCLRIIFLPIGNPLKSPNKAKGNVCCNQPPTSYVLSSRLTLFYVGQPDVRWKRRCYFRTREKACRCLLETRARAQFETAPLATTGGIPAATAAGRTTATAMLRDTSSAT